MTPAGRPPISGERQNQRIEVRFTDAERSVIEAAVTLAGVKTATWARDVLLAAAAELTAAQSAPRKKSAKRT